MPREKVNCEQLASGACGFLDHYHRKHTEDKISHFHQNDGETDIYVVSDPECRRKFEETYLALIEPDTPVQ